MIAAGSNAEVMRPYGDKAAAEKNLVLPGEPEQRGREFVYRMLFNAPAGIASRQRCKV